MMTPLEWDSAAKGKARETAAEMLNDATPSEGARRTAVARSIYCGIALEGVGVWLLTLGLLTSDEMVMLDYEAQVQTAKRRFDTIYQRRGAH